MIKRTFRLPLWVAIIPILVISGCGKKLPTATDSGQGYRRALLVELFTSEFCSNCPKADAAAERLASEMGNSLCLVEMHPITFQASGGNIDSLGLAATDTLATAYEAGFGADAGLPYFSCDGLIDKEGVGAPDTQSAYLKYQQMVDIRKAITSPLQIVLTSQLDQGGIRYSAAINSDASLPPSLKLGLVFVVVEDSVAAYGKQNRYVARKVYPSTRGDSLVLTASSSLTRMGIIPSDPGWLPYRLTLMAYVRNNSTKEIIQAAKIRIVAATTPPAAPSLYLPVNGATGISLSPSLSWNASGGAASYTLQYDTDSLFTGGISQSGITSTSFKVSNLTNSTTYYWRVNASNNAGLSAWSTVRSFTTTATALPPAPVQASPYNGANGISRSPILAWGTVPGAASYDIQVAIDNSFAPQVMVAAPSGLTGTSYLLLGLDSSATYYWRVRVANVAGISAWSSPVWWFITTNGAPPAIPTLTSPANGELNSGISPSLNWSASAGATDYTLQVSPYSDFRYLSYNQSGLTATNFTTAGLDSLTTYYWRVSATNASGTSDWSDSWAFTDSRGYSFSRVVVSDTLTWAPDTIVTFSLQDTLMQPEIPGFNLYFTNLTATRLTLWNHAPRSMCSDTVLMGGGSLCNTVTCGMTGGDLWDNRWDFNNTQHWTVHMVFTTTYPPVGTYSFTLLSWSDDNPGQVMSRKLYIEVIP